MAIQYSTTGDARLDQLAQALGAEFAGIGCEVKTAPGEVTLVLPRSELIDVATRLRDDEQFAFVQLTDLCGVDYAAYGKAEWATEDASVTGFGRGVDRGLDLDADDPKRFAVVYHLLSLSHNRRLRVRAYAGGTRPVVDSVIEIWTCADWFEREAFDMYGILFRGHPDLRRILCDYGFIGHAFRKDFPLSGHVEMRYDPAQQRVVYEPVTIEPRVLVPKVIRDDSRYVKEPGQQQTDGFDA